MSSMSEFIREELPEVEQIVRNECWLEGERRGSPVLPSDPAIRAKVAEIIIAGAGAEIRRRHSIPNGSEIDGANHSPGGMGV